MQDRRSREFPELVVLHSCGLAIPGPFVYLPTGHKFAERRTRRYCPLVFRSTAEVAARILWLPVPPPKCSGVRLFKEASYPRSRPQVPATPFQDSCRCLTLTDTSKLRPQFYCTIDEGRKLVLRLQNWLYRLSSVRNDLHIAEFFEPIFAEFNANP